LAIREDTHYRWPWLVRAVDEIQDIDLGTNTFSEARDVFSIGGTTGFGGSGSLGGAVTPNAQLMLEVKSPKRLLLKGSVQNSYTGSGWNTDFTCNRYQTASIWHEKTLNTSFDLDEQLYKGMDTEAQARFIPVIDVEIKVKDLYSSCLFISSYFHEIQFPSGNIKAYFNEKGETFTSRPLYQDEKYTVKIMSPDYSNEEFIRLINLNAMSVDFNQPLPNDMREQVDLYNKLSFVKNHYMSLPGNLPQEVGGLTRQIIEGKSTSLQKMAALEKYLKENYTYTLEPPALPQGADFVQHFLF
jgi:hypothetical protein